MSSPTTRRTVLVLGRSAKGTCLPPVAQRDDGLVVVAIGWPLTEHQRAAVDAAEEIARSVHVVIDAHLVASASAAADLVGSRDRLLLDAGPREARRIRRTLSRRLNAPGAR